MIGSLSMRNSIYQGSSSSYRIMKLNCTGNEDTIWDCDSSEEYQYCYYPAHVACHG